MERNRFPKNCNPNAEPFVLLDYLAFRADSSSGVISPRTRSGSPRTYHRPFAGVI